MTRTGTTRFVYEWRLLNFGLSEKFSLVNDDKLVYRVTRSGLSVRQFLEKSREPVLSAWYFFLG